MKQFKDLHEFDGRSQLFLEQYLLLRGAYKLSDDLTRFLARMLQYGEDEKRRLGLAPAA